MFHFGRNESLYDPLYFTYKLYVHRIPTLSNHKQTKLYYCFVSNVNFVTGTVTRCLQRVAWDCLNQNCQENYLLIENKSSLIC